MSPSRAAGVMLHASCKKKKKREMCCIFIRLKVLILASFTRLSCLKFILHTKSSRWKEFDLVHGSQSTRLIWLFTRKSLTNHLTVKGERTVTPQYTLLQMKSLNDGSSSPTYSTIFLLIHGPTLLSINVCRKTSTSNSNKQGGHLLELFPAW